MTVNEIISDWLTATKQALIDNYDSLGLRVSGNWADELEEFALYSPDKIKIGIKGAQYTGALTEGRNPNADQSPEKLKAWVGWAGSTFLNEWVLNKGLDISPYAVAWKVALQGWEVPNRFNEGGLVDNVITDERGADLRRDLSLFYINDFKASTIKQFNLIKG